MRDDLRIIDIIERLKGRLFVARPQLADLCRQRLEAFEADHPIRYYKERLLAAFAQAAIHQPSLLRQVSRFVRRAEEEPETLRREIAAEEPAPFYARMSKAKREAMLQCLNGFAAFDGDPHETGRAFGKTLRGLDRPESARVFVKKHFPNIKGLDAYRVLKAWDFPLILPDARRQQLFYRLGALPSRSTAAEGLRRMLDLGESVHRLTGEPLQTLDLLTGVFAGAEPGHPAELAVCAARPRCPACPVSAYCEYFRYNQKPKDADKHATIKDWDINQRPRERLMRHGAAQLNDAELLAILLRTGTAKSTALELAHQLLRRFHGMKGFDDATLGELCGQKGMGSVKAVTLKAALELGKRLMREAGETGHWIQSSYDVFHLFRHRFTSVKVEQFYLLCLNIKHDVIHEAMVSQGSLGASLVHPREAFKDAIRQSAASVIFVHNHPSGDPTPSDQDRQITERLQESGRILGISVLDHVIIGAGRYYSLQEDQLFDFSDGEDGGEKAAE